MAMHRDRIDIKEASDWVHTRERLHQFYEVNGYALVTDDPLAYERGSSGAGWWTSEMSKLHARHMLKYDEEAMSVSVSLDVDVTGQHMTSEDLAFWRTELTTLQEFMEAPDSVAKDLRKGEHKRAREGRRETLKLSVYGFFITFSLLFIIMIVLQRMGLIMV